MQASQSLPLPRLGEESILPSLGSPVGDSEGEALGRTACDPDTQPDQTPPLRCTRREG